MGKFRKSETASGDHRGDNDPADKNHEWLEIYAKLKESIGEWPAYNWFGHCRYLSRHDGAIRLEHWTPWAAEEALRRHGFALCAAGGVQRALVRHNGGIVPHGVVGRKSSGYAEYTVPQKLSDDRTRRLEAMPGVVRALSAPAPARGANMAHYDDI